MTIVLISLGGCAGVGPQQNNYPRDSRYNYESDRPYDDTHMNYFYGKGAAY